MKRDRPNILQITTHDSGRHFGCYGHPTLHTPNIDALASDGIRFDQYFCAVPICSASRACMLTGLYPQSNGLLDLTAFGWRIRDDVPHMSVLLKRAGYRTALFGVQHEVLEPQLGRLAFDEVHTCRRAREAAEDVAEFLDRAGTDAPFYAQIGFLETHTPFLRDDMQPDTERGVEIPPYLADTPAARTTMAGYQRAVRDADAGVGRILDALRCGGWEENTLVVFTTDHGIEVPRAKWYLYDPGIAIAMVLRHPAGGLVGGRVCDLLLSNVDYLPTIFELAGVDIPTHAEGRSFADRLLQCDPAPTREFIHGMYHKNQTRCVRSRRYKQIRHFSDATDFHRLPVICEEVLNKKVIDRIELFDLEEDPNEFVNVANHPKYADIRRRLDTELWCWMESVDDPLLKGPVRSPSYDRAIADYADWRAARPDAVESGLDGEAPTRPPGRT